jgi:hypothetical protein
MQTLAFGRWQSRHGESTLRTLRIPSGELTSLWATVLGLLEPQTYPAFILPLAIDRH